MQPRDVVELECYNLYGECVLRKDIGRYEWHDEPRPIIDDDEERKRLGVVEMFGRQYDLEGHLSARWRNSYDANGSITDSWEWRSDGSTSHRRFVEDRNS